MKSEWKVTSNYIDDEKVYGVYRLINVNETDHSGNREYSDIGYVSSREEAVREADGLNEAEVHEEKRRFVSDLWKALRKYYPEMGSMEYINKNHMEYVVLSYINGGNRRINVTLDSLSAMMRDISNWL